jgi:tRNA (cmo5U34)-methyltransferase
MKPKTFSFDTIENFDNHIDQSIPNFGVLINSTKSIAEYFYVKGTNVYDLGCSTGKMLKEINTDCNKIGYDIASLLPDDKGFFSVDLNSEFPLENASVVFSIFTMQFLDPSKREQYIKTIYDGMNQGGALFMCEKIYRTDGKLQEIMSFAHYDHKLKSFPAEDIIAKERDLRFIMKPWQDDRLNKALQAVGFEISVYWSMFNFKGIIALKK